jgi:transcriptional regulator with XRE-family HTH domain
VSAHLDSVSMRLFWEVVRQGWTLDDVAKRSGVSAERLSELFWNLTPPEPQELKSLAEALVAATASAEEVQTNEVHEHEQAAATVAEPADQAMLAQMTAMLDAMRGTLGRDG